MRNGIINVYKEKGFTSFDVVAKLRGILKQKRIGHTGTLDPDATGVLLVCLGNATKVCDLLTDKDKEYEAVLLLGKTTDTQDISGQVLREAKVTASEDEVCRTIQSFVGEYEQIPPMYSALKVNGRKLCDLAREGITVERKARRVTIYSIEILSVCLPEVKMRVHCSKGTYIRTLCQDIGEALGCGGCMRELVRTRVSSFSIEDAHTLAEIEKAVRLEQLDYVVPVDAVFEQYPKGVADQEFQKFLENGHTIPEKAIHFPDSVDFAPTIRMYDYHQRFVGLFSYVSETKAYKPIKMFLAKE